MVDEQTLQFKKKADVFLDVLFGARFLKQFSATLQNKNWTDVKSRIEAEEEEKKVKRERTLVIDD